VLIKLSSAYVSVGGFLFCFFSRSIDDQGKSSNVRRRAICLLLMLRILSLIGGHGEAAITLSCTELKNRGH